jgi:2-oxoisovalerate dehydrogenase E2 component (dihydrolipoyl transacylase)
MAKVTMPQLGESVAEGTIGKWLKQPGDHVDKYEPLVEVITDKVNAEVPSPIEGTLREILVQEGQTVPNNAEIAVIETADEGAGAGDGGAAEGGQATVQATAEAPGATADAAEEPAEGSASAPATAAPVTAGGNGREPERTVLGTGQGPAGSDERSVEEVQRSAPAATATPPTAAAAPPSAPGREYTGPVTPAVRRLAREHGIDLSLVAGTGHSGRITREDVLGFVEAQRAGAAAPAPPAPTAPVATAQPSVAPAAAAAQPSAAPAAAAPTPTGAPAVVAPAPAAAAAAPVESAPQRDELKPITPMRKAIAAHMVKAKQEAPHAYTTVEVDMSGVVALRDAAKARYQAQEGIALSFVAIVAKGVVEALERHRELNAHWTEEGLLRKADINLGIAVAVDDGLVVPVIKKADEYSIHGLNLFLQDFAARARANRLRLEDVQGGTFTLNNTGWFGSVASQPIVNVPEVAILSMEAIVKRPVVIETPGGDTIGIHPVMNLCVSFDHRATDGAQIGRFVQDVRAWLESVSPDTPIW